MPTVARLMAELGIDGYQDYKRQLKDAENNLKSLGREIDAISKRQVAANRQNEAASKAAAKADKDAEKATKDLTVAQNQQVITTNRLIQVTEKLSLTEEQQEAIKEKLRTGNQSLTKSELEYVVALNAVEKANNAVVNTTLKQISARDKATEAEDAAKRAAMEHASSLALVKEKIEALAPATTEVIRLTNLQAQSEENAARAAIEAAEVKKGAKLSEVEANKAAEQAKTDYNMAAENERTRSTVAGIEARMAAEEAAWAELNAGLSAMLTEELAQITTANAKIIAVEEARVDAVAKVENKGREGSAAYWNAQVADAVRATKAIEAAQLASQNRVANTFRNATDRLGSASSSLKHFGTSATFTATAPIAIADAFSVDAAIKMERYKNALNQVTHSAEKTDMLIKQLDKDAELPGVEFEGMIKGVATLTNVGESVKQARNELIQLGNEVRREGKSMEDYNAMIRQITQWQGMDRISTQEVRQTVRILPGFNQFLGKQYGTTDPKEINQMGVSGKQMVADFTAWEATQKRVVKSVEDDLDDLKRSIFMTAAKWGNELLPVIKETAPIVTETLSNAVKWFSSLDDGTKRNIVNMTLFAAAVGPVAMVLGQVLGVAKGLVAFSGSLVSVISRIGGVVSGIVQAFQVVGAGAGTFSEGLALSFSPLIVELAPILAGIAAVAAGIWLLKKAYDALFPSMQSVNEQWAQEATQRAQSAVSQAVHGKQIGDLAQKYMALSISTADAKTIQEQQQSILEKLVKLNPDFISGVNAQGKYIANTAKITAEANIPLEKRVELLRQANQLSAVTKAGNLAQQMDDVRDQIADTTYKVNLAKYYQNGKYDKNRRDQNGYTVDQNEGAFFFSKANAKDRNDFDVYTKQLNELNAQLKDMTQQWKDATAVARTFGKNYVKPLTGADDPYGDPADQAFKPKPKPYKLTADDRSAISIGEDLINNITKSMASPKLKASCADFASRLLANLGMAVPTGKSTIQGAKALRDYVSSHGTQVDQANAKPGDLVIWRGPKFGVQKFQEGNERVGYHAGVVGTPGATKVFTSSGGKRGHEVPMYEAKKATFYHMSGSLGEQADAVSAMAGSAKEATKELTPLQQKVIELGKAQVDLKFKLKETSDMTGAQSLALQYAKENFLEYGNAIPAQVAKMQKANVAWQTMVDLHEKLAAAQNKVKDQQLKNNVDALGPRKAEMVNAFGAKEWFQLSEQAQQFMNSGDKTSANKIWKTQQTFASNFWSDKDRDDSKEAIKNLQEFRKEIAGLQDEVGDPNAESIKANNWISKFLEDLKLKGLQLTPAMRDSIEEIKQLAHYADLKKAGPTMGDEAWTADLEARRNNSMDVVKRTDTAMFNASGVNASPYDSWLNSQKQLVGHEFKLPAGVSAEQWRSLYDSEKLEKAKTTIAGIMDDSIKTAAQMNANNPYQAWLVSMMEVNRETGQMQLPTGFDPAAMKDIYDFQQKIAHIQELAGGLRDLFGNVINDIANNGFANLWSNIFNGFQQLLFKMGVEYLESILYQSLLNGISGIFGVKAPAALTGAKRAGGGPVNQFSSYIVGEKGRELFVPSQPGYIFSGQSLSSLTGGSATMQNFGGSSNGSVRSGMFVSNDSNDKNVTIHQTFNNHYHGTSPEQARSMSRQTMQDAQREAMRLQQRRG